MTKILIILLPVLILIAYAKWPEQPLPEGIKADKLIVNKAKREMEFWSNGERIKTYRISLGGNPLGHKLKQGDSRTPEGLYSINDKNANSRFHLNLGISYPNKTDRSNSDNPGGDIKIHGLKNGNGWIGKFQRLYDWTDGCIAITNLEVEELFASVPIGTPIRINP
ncbi:L,D-transpeptidase family protein [Fulvivirga sp. M361]|nr:L,D-transpeptidase family protein [Fulvivirga sp. M361]